MSKERVRSDLKRLKNRLQLSSWLALSVLYICISSKRFRRQNINSAGTVRNVFLKLKKQVKETLCVFKSTQMYLAGKTNQLAFYFPVFLYSIFNVLSCKHIVQLCPADGSEMDFFLFFLGKEAVSLCVCVCVCTYISVKDSLPAGHNIVDGTVLNKLS